MAAPPQHAYPGAALQAPEHAEELISTLAPYVPLAQGVGLVA